MTKEQILNDLSDSNGVIILREQKYIDSQGEEQTGYHTTDADRFFTMFGDAFLTYSALYGHPNANETWRLHFDALKAAGKIS